MKSDESIIEIIKIKVLNTINLEQIDRNVMTWVEKKSDENPLFRGHYYLPYELISDIKLIENQSRHNELIIWLKSLKSKDPIIKQALNEMN